jgi:hypothetical protein
MAAGEDVIFVEAFRVSVFRGWVRFYCAYYRTPHQIAENWKRIIKGITNE